MISYLEQLKTKAEAAGVFLYKAFEKAGLNPSTYARTRQDKTSLRLRTALKVSKAIDQLAVELRIGEAKRKAESRPPKTRTARLRVISTEET